MDQTTDTAKRQLAELATMADQGSRMDKAIFTAAIARLESIDAKLNAIDRAGVVKDDTVAKQYQELILERASLHQVISRARAAAGGSH